MSRIVLKYTSILVLALCVLKLLEYGFFSHKISLQAYLEIIASLFFTAGLFAAWFLMVSMRRTKFVRNRQENLQDNPFSERELQVLRYLADGSTNKQIARDLNISPNTVKTHVSNLYEKLGVCNRTQAATEARLLNLLN